MSDINELAVKKLNTRLTRIRKCNRDETEKEKFFNQLGVSFEIFFPNKEPEKLSDSLLIWTNPKGKVTHAEYSYEKPEEEEFTSIPLTEKKIKPFIEAFSDFKLELDDS